MNCKIMPCVCVSHKTLDINYCITFYIYELYALDDLTTC